MAVPLKNLMSGVIFDLDGTLLNTDGIISDVFKVFLVKYGKQWDGRETHKIAGKMPLVAATAVVKDYELPCTASEFISAVTPMFSDKWGKAKALPGANRLIKHLSNHGVPMALASNSPRESIEARLVYHEGWKESFSFIICGEEVKMGKPSPEIYLEAAKRLMIDPTKCLVIEDSLPGMTAGKAAGMEVVVVPSLPKQSHLYTSADEVIHSLLDLRPEKWGLPPFRDCKAQPLSLFQPYTCVPCFPFHQSFIRFSGIGNTLPIEPWYIGGPVIKGFGRGSKMLGIPTANISIKDYSDLVSEHPSGVYFGWAALPNRGVYKMVMSIGWNPYFNNVEKTIEPWLLHNFDEDFYGEELHLAIVGYIRPEANYPDIESLITNVREDREIAEQALELPLYSKYKEDPYMKELIAHV